MMSSARQMAIIEALKRVGAEQPCERCKYATFEVAGEGRRFLIPGEDVGGCYIPTILLACQRCGLLAEHATKILGVL